MPSGKLQLGSTVVEQAFLVDTLPGRRRPPWLDDENMTTRGIYTAAGFWMGKYEVTQTEWAAVIGSNPSVFNGKAANKAKGMNTSRFPVENVSWNDCQAFLKKLNENPTAIEKALGSRAKFALPHENEWEYACRGGKGIGFPFHFGTVLNGTQANCKGTEPWGPDAKPGPNLERTTTVGNYAKEFGHPWGLCDMHGNVEEWCENKYEALETRALRGGRWEVTPWACRSANRNQTLPANKGASVGVRICIRAN